MTSDDKNRFRKRFMDCSGLTLAEAEPFGTFLARQQRDIMWWLGDLAKHCDIRWPSTHFQAWPEWISPGLLARAAAVARAYPTEEDRRHDCTWTQYMQHAGRQDRHERLAEIEAAGLTTDESRKADKTDKARWLLAIDVNYYLHRFWYSGAAVESAVTLTDWIVRTVERLQAKGLTDVACCFDAPHNHRKEFTAEWEDKYKDRPPKDPELSQQLHLVRDLLHKKNFACLSVAGMEADDCLASLAVQFAGRVTILTQDKDCRQCLSAKCNMLLDVEWSQDDTSGDMVPEYKWLSAAAHTEATGLTPEQWIEYQCLMGDNVDGIKGAVGIGAKGAADLVKEFGTADDAIAAARSDDERIKPAKRKALVEFADRLEVTRKLVTLRTDLRIEESTRV